MVSNNDQSEPSVPLSNIENRETSNLLPRYYRTKGNKKFLQGTLDQLTQPGTVKKISGFIGRENAKATTSNDIFLAASDKARQDYQLEPAAVIKDYLGNTTFFKDYIDHVNHVSVFDGNVDNHARLNKQEFYNWNPHIEWDKFVNFQRYYWLPFGPEPIKIFGQQREVISEFAVRTVDEEDNVAYLFDPEGPKEGLIRNPTLRLFRGQTYVFDIESKGHPFSIKTKRTAGPIDRYLVGVEGVAVEHGKITFTVPNNAPDVLYYASEIAVDTGGVFHVLDIEENTFLDVEVDILGKRNYTVPNGDAAAFKLSNGMKIEFGGQVQPEIYAQGYWYVEGVGTAVKLISERDLEIRSTYVEESTLLFDDFPFDQLPYSETGTFPVRQDYITINRSSIDNNPWSRYNRWFHEDVIKTSAVVNGKTLELNLATRATRPIIEFLPNIKLHNYGITAKKAVDVIDNFTKDVFSTIEGSLGYNIDGVDLVDGMRVLFNADTDPLVKNKIYKVNFINFQSPGLQVNFDPESAVRLDTSTIVFASEHGLSSGTQVTYLQNGNDSIPGLTNRQNYFVKAVNTLTVALYSDRQLTKQIEIFALASGTHQFEIFVGRNRQIYLSEEFDAVPALDETVSIRFGTNDEIVAATVYGNRGQNYWYNGTTWKLAQIKVGPNIPPLFDVFDSNGDSYADASTYEGSSFSGNKIFSYKQGNGPMDSTLGFALSYKNINNVGDIVFDFNLLKDEFSYKTGLLTQTKPTNIGYLKLSQSLTNFKFENSWVTSAVKNSQPIVRVFKESGLVNNFPVDVFKDKNNLADLDVRVYVNGRRVNKDLFTVEDSVVNKVVVLSNNVTSTDVVTLKCYATQKKNEKGYYEIPINLQNNPLNQDISEFTLGQVIDHVDTIIDNITGFEGTYPGNNNLRDLGNLSSYGTRFVQHSGPLNLSLYHFGSKDANLIRAMDQARNDYNQFKRAFIIAANSSGIDADPKEHVDFILQELSKDKPKSRSYYLSDMFAYTASNRIEIFVLDSRIKIYPLTNVFNLKTSSNKAVNIYLNGQQLTHERDYSFNDEEFFTISNTVTLTENDLIEVYEYDSTDGCFCAPTPTKLGLFPAFEPKIYIDTSYLEPVKVIQGHDGSVVIAYNDYRDNLILELEKRIFNNIKVKYNTEVFDIYNYIPGYNRSTDYSIKEFNAILAKYFFQWTLNIPQDYTKPDDTVYDRFNSFTWNYRGNYTPDEVSTPAAWRGIYRWMFDTTVPHIKPWECLGYSVEPAWWQDTYGPAPYTSDNLILWEDLKDGRIKEPGRPVRLDPKFARPILTYGVPVDAAGNLISPQTAKLSAGVLPVNDGGFFEFGDEHTVEAAWRKSSYYPFAIIQTLLLMHPSEVMARCFDRSRIVKNLTGQLVYADTNLRIKLSNIAIPSTSASVGDRTYAAGLINYIVDYLTNERTDKIDQYQQDLQSLTNNISTRIGGFTSKDKYKLLLDSKNPKSSGGVFVPNENYFVDLNVSSAVKKVVYSGVIVTKFADGFEIRGYNFENPYFNYYNYRAQDRTIRVGGISETFSTWAAGRTYVAGKIVFTGDQYYRVLVNHNSGEQFDSSLYVKLPQLPIVGGREAVLGKYLDTTEVKTIAYGTKLTAIQEVVDFLQGYGAWLETQGFVFDDFNTEITDVANWETSIREFLFWTTQGWDEGSVLSLSPGADRLVFRSSNSVVDSIVNDFHDYSVFRVDGQKLDPQFIQVYRGNSEFVIEPDKTNYGIYGITLYLVQKEHIVLLDGSTLFNDTIYDIPAGYRQEKIKALGYVTSNWNGGFEIPGFIYDRAVINAWTPWVDYNLGDIVKYKEFYYSARKFLPGVEIFDNTHWVLLDKKPKNELMPNWDYRAEQFTDFYDLDTDNFDADQQKIAQHLTGYQKRQYLENIINNDVSQYKFYQGMIPEKGTLNVLNKLFDVLSAADKESLTFDEEWAFRVGEYGALDTFEEVEFVLDESQFKINPQPLELVNAINTTDVDFVYRQTLNDVYIKPSNFTNKVWQTKQLDNFLRTPGYIRKEDVRINLNSVTDLVDVDIEGFMEGDYVWTAFEGTSWNVYRFTKSKYKILNATHTSNLLEIQCNRSVDYQVGQVIGIETPINETTIDGEQNTNVKLQGFFVIKQIQLNKIIVDADITGFDEFDIASPAILYIMTSQRISNIDDANHVIQSYIKPNEYIWADDSGSGDWAVYENNPVYSKVAVIDNAPIENAEFGTGVALAESGNKAAIANKNQVTLYSKSSTDNAWKRFQIIQTESDSTIVKFSRDGAFLVISHPVINAVKIYKRNDSPTNQDAASTSTGSYYLVETVDKPLDNLFGKKITIAKKDNQYMIAVSAENTVYAFTHVNEAWTELSHALTGTDGFGHDISLSDSFVLAVSSPNATGVGKVDLYLFNGSAFVTVGTSIVDNTDDDTVQFGQSVAVSASGSYMAIGASLEDVGQKLDVGVVYIYKFNGTTYDNVQKIYSRQDEINEQFGTTVEFINNDSSLAIYSLNSDVQQISTFDNNQTVFDNNSLRFADTTIDIGRVDIYERYNVNFIYGETLQADVDPNNGYGKQIAVGGNTVLVSASLKTVDNILKAGTVYSYAKPSATRSWTAVYERSYKVDVSAIKKAFLYNKSTNQLITYLDVVDPTQNKIPGIADQEIKFKSYYDPAVYSIGTDEVVVDDGLSWENKHVGMLWWDLTNAKFLDTESGNVVYRTSTWNKLYDTASIDIFEWVESPVLPQVWDAQVDTEAGIANGFSGSSKYGNGVYSVNRKYDNVSQQFVNTYYFWVKNKITVPFVEGRNISANDIARLISDPAGYGYSCLAFTDANSVAIVNSKKYLENSNTVLSIQYWTNEDRTNNYHSEWKLLSTNRNTIIPAVLEEKWFHSLVGKDDADRIVPDVNLPLKQRYGIEYRPRQGMFVNRIEALKQYVERVNSVLSTVLVTDTYDISSLQSFDQSPRNTSGSWDLEIDTDAELRFVQTSQIATADISLIVNDGRIVGGTINNSGYGYGTFRTYKIDETTDQPVSWYGPTVSIFGQGQGASLKTIVNKLGQVTSLLIEDTGEGYADDTAVSVRAFTVLVTSDSATNTWALYSFDKTSAQWNKTKVQSYNVNDYWKYIDWYLPEYNQFTKTDYLFDNTHQLVTSQVELGAVVKIRNIGAGGWVLLEKYNDAATIDYTENYKTVGRENGSIQFLDNLYNPTKGYDRFLLDSVGYDSYPTEDLKIILTAVRDNLLVDELKVEYLKLFFASVRYALYEQTFVDWAMKTSFVKAMHNLGELNQKVTYNSDNLEFFEDYIKEVKPYRTKIREYVSNYTKVEPTETLVTDFDLLPVIDESYNVNPLTVQVNDSAEIVSGYAELLQDPWLQWTENLGFEIVSIEIVDPGEGYAFRPVVRIDGVQFAGGNPAAAKAYITKGKVNRIQLINTGSKWIKAPTVTIDGTLLEGGRAARAVAIIGNSPVRTNYIKMKFDRISKTYQVTTLEQVEIFNGSTVIAVSGSRTQFPLQWSPNIVLDTYSVEIDNVDVLKNEYQVATVETIVDDGSVKYSGLLTFAVPPAAGTTVQIRYQKNFEHLSATDRINFYYNPKTGQTGKDLSQLMTGIDYGGVTVTGMDFDNTFGWDAAPWFSDVWDSTSFDFEDYIVLISDSDPATYMFRLPYVPAQTEIINVYISKFDLDNQRYLTPVRIDDLDYLTINQKNQNAIMTSFTGDGEIDLVALPPTAALVVNDKVIFRKITSDGSVPPKEDDYDTVLTGGDLSYATATGFNPDDIILDGDDFVTPMTSHAPEEIVPGQVMDTLAIKVYTRPTGGVPNMLFKTYFGNGDQTDFTIGQHFQNKNAVIVKVGDQIKQLAIDYTIDYQNNLVIFSTAPSINLAVTILSINFSSANILDLDYFVADGTTTEYITKAPWLITANATVLVNGDVFPYEIFSTDNEYTDNTNNSWISRVGIKFLTAPPAGAIVNYMIDRSDTEQTACVVKSEMINYTLSEDTYNLINAVGTNKPFEPNVLVKTGNTILKSPSYEYFTMVKENEKNKLIYELKDSKYQKMLLVAADFKVYIEGNLLTLNQDYTVDFNYPNPYYILDESTVTATGSEYTINDILTVVGGNVGTIGRHARLQVTGIISSNGSTGFIREVEVIDPGLYLTPPEFPLITTGGSGSDARINGTFELTEDLSRYAIKLRSKVFAKDKNLTIGVTKNADYEFLSDKVIRFTQPLYSVPFVEVISFYNHNILNVNRTIDTFDQSPVLAINSPEFYEFTGKFMGVFKLPSTVASGNFVWVIKNGELLANLVDYYLENDFQTIKLEVAPSQTDIVQIIAFANTVVTDDFGYMQFKDIVNRVHYKRLNRDKSTKLAASLKQFDKTIELENALVLDTPITFSNTPGIIEINGERIEYFVKHGNTLSQLRRATLGTGSPAEHSVGTVVQNLGLSETIPYKDEFLTETFIADGVTTNIVLPSKFYQDIAHSSPVVNKDQIEVFVGGYRLKKNQYTLYTDTAFPYSPQGDTVQPAEFLIDGVNLQLSHTPSAGVKIIVVRKQGSLWNDLGKRLANSNNSVAKFVKATKAVWPN